MKNKIITAFVAFCLCVSLVIGQRIDDILGDLDSIATKELEKASSATSKRRPRIQKLAQVPDLVGRIRLDMTDENFADATQTASELLVSFDKPEAIAKARQLFAMVNEHRQKAEQARLAALDEFIRRAAPIADHAIGPAELDPILEEAIMRLPPRSDPLSPQFPVVTAKLNSILSFIRQWQEYLALQKANRTSEARAILQRLADANDFPVLPRSAILNRIASPPNDRSQQLDEIMARTKTLDDIPTALEEIRKLTPPGANQTQEERDTLWGTLNTLVWIDSNYRDWKAGLPTSLGNPQIFSAPVAHPAVLSLKRLLLVTVLPTTLGLPEEFKPRPNERVDAFLDRAIKEAAQKNDFESIIKAQQIYYKLTGNSPFPNRSYGMLIAAFKQETAGQFAYAVATYEEALKTADPGVPADVVGRRLAAIKASHPQDYAEGLRYFSGAQPGK